MTDLIIDVPAVLRRVPYFAELPAERLAVIARGLRVLRFAVNARIVTEGQTCAGLYVVLTGRVTVFKAAESGRQQVLRILGPGRSFNDVPVFDGGSNPGNVAALDACSVGLLAKSHMQSLIADEPAVAAAVIRVLAMRLRAMTAMVEDLALRGLTARIARLLLETSRGRMPLAEGADAGLSLTQGQLAAMVGSVREVVHRALKALEQDGAIALGRGRIRVLDPALLELWSNAQRA